jgi:hypothetical protein
MLPQHTVSARCKIVAKCHRYTSKLWAREHSETLERTMIEPLMNAPAQGRNKAQCRLMQGAGANEYGNWWKCTNSWSSHRLDHQKHDEQGGPKVSLNLVPRRRPTAQRDNLHCIAQIAELIAGCCMDVVTVLDALLMVFTIAEDVSRSSIRLAPHVGQDDGLTCCLDVRIARMLSLTREKPRTAPTREVPFSLEVSTIQIVHHACSRA